MPIALTKFGAGAGEDPFAKAKGFITDVIHRLQAQASSEANRKSQYDALCIH